MVNHTIAVCLGLVVLGFVCSPVIAHTAAQRGISPDQYDRGIPVYWPYHAFLMSAGFILLLSGFAVMRFHRTSNWYKSHRILESAGGIFSITGLVAGITMVSISGAPHLRYAHDILGPVTIILIACTLLLEYFMNGVMPGKSGVRKTHRWLGGISIILVAVNILLGISMMTTVLAQ
jgi:heme A synthase